jgi:hypothetical protein
MTEDNFLPFLPDGISDMELPVHSLEESHLVGVDLTNLEARDLAPSASRVVTILQVL